MRIIVIRHAQSTNNILSEISYDAYSSSRTEDPMITEKGEENCIILGKFLKNNNFKIDKFYCSASLRSLMTMDIIANVYDKGINKELFLEIHEFGGVYRDDEGMPGMSSIEIKSRVGDIIIPDEENLKNGWWKNDKKENENDFKERVKKAIYKLKELAKVSDEDYTVCLVTHGLFMNAFFSSLLGCELFVENMNFGFKNLSISSIYISKKKEVKLEFLNFEVEDEIFDE